MVKRAARVGTMTGFLLALLGLIVWATGRPFIFPSLGPTAFALALAPNEHSMRQVVGGHLCGVLAGLLAYHAAAPGLAITTTHVPLAGSGLRPAASGPRSVALTAGGMLLTRTVHAPACATTLIISLGLLSGVVEAAIIMVSVVLLYGANGLFQRESLERAKSRERSGVRSGKS